MYNRGGVSEANGCEIGDLKHPLVDFIEDEKEYWYFDFFRTRTAPMLSGYFDSDSWSRLVVQISHCEPTVRHAIMAVSFLHERSEHLREALMPAPGQYLLSSIQRIFSHCNITIGQSAL